MPISWKGHTEAAAKAGRARENMRRATVDLAKYHAGRGETAMKDEASWTDRTGNARGGLFGEAKATPNGAEITLGGVMAYQKFLELGTSRSAPYPIIVPITDRTYREVSRDLKNLADRMGGAS